MTTGRAGTVVGMTHFLAVVLDVEVGVIAACQLIALIRSL